MILAAGLGTRLRPLTDRIPKPLIPVGGVPLLERIARRLIAAGADRLIINTHQHAAQIEKFVETRDNFGVDVAFSHEPEQPYDTGGGLLHARRHFRLDAPFFLHNGDILTDAPLAEMYAAHKKWSASLVTLAARPPEPERYLIFDDAGLLGYAPRGGGAERIIRGAQGVMTRYEFAGIHVVDPRIFDLMQEHGADEHGVFSIIDVYLRLARAGERIAPFLLDGMWLDIGTPERLAEAEAALRRMKLLP